MGIEFFWMPGGPFALRCLMTLAVKELPYRSRQLDVAKQENRTPEFLAMSPSGSLPVLKDGAIVVRESQAIMFYLDRAYPQMPLYGTTPSAAGRIMQEICEQQSYAEPALQPLIGALFFNRTTTADNMAQATERFAVLLQELNKRLAGAGWLAGENLSAADLSIFPLVRAVLKGFSSEKAASLSMQAPSLEGAVSVIDWMRRLERFASAEQEA